MPFLAHLRLCQIVQQPKRYFVYTGQERNGHCLALLVLRVPELQDRGFAKNQILKLRLSTLHKILFLTKPIESVINWLSRYLTLV